jgi:hypothetical protein
LFSRAYPALRPRFVFGNVRALLDGPQQLAGSTFLQPASRFYPAGFNEPGLNQ